MGLASRRAGTIRGRSGPGAVPPVSPPNLPASNHPVPQSSSRNPTQVVPHSAGVPSQSQPHYDPALTIAELCPREFLSNSPQRDPQYGLISGRQRCTHSVPGFINNGGQKEWKGHRVGLLCSVADFSVYRLKHLGLFFDPVYLRQYSLVWYRGFYFSSM